MPDPHVRPNSEKLTDEDARKYLSEAYIMGICQKLGPSKVAALTGEVNEKTMRRLRDRETLIEVTTAFNMLDADPHILDGLAAAKGFVLIPMVDASADVIPMAGAAIHRIGQNRCPTSPGGATETDDELIATEAENDALLAAVIERRCAIAKAKLRKAQKAP